MTCLKGDLRLPPFTWIWEALTCVHRIRQTVIYIIIDQPIYSDILYGAVSRLALHHHERRRLGSYSGGYFCLQEEERRIALVMARKEEEKKRESNKTNIMKVRNDPLLSLLFVVCLSSCNYMETPSIHSL